MFQLNSAHRQHRPRPRASLQQNPSSSSSSSSPTPSTNPTSFTEPPSSSLLSPSSQFFQSIPSSSYTYLNKNHTTTASISGTTTMFDTLPISSTTTSSSTCLITSPLPSPLPSPSPSTTSILSLYIIYDADGTLTGELLYIAKKALGLAHCAACDITHGPRREKPEFTALKTTTGWTIPLLNIHRDEMDETMNACVGNQLPCVVARTDLGDFILVKRNELEECAGSVDSFVYIVDQRANKMGLGLKRVPDLCTRVVGNTTVLQQVVPQQQQPEEEFNGDNNNENGGELESVNRVGSISIGSSQQEQQQQQFVGYHNTDAVVPSNTTTTQESID